MGSWAHRVAAAWEKLAVTLILAGLLAALVVQAWRVGVTVDEPSHLLSSHLYWRGADRLMPQDLPPLIKIVAGWAPGRFALPLPADLGNEKDTRHEWDVSLEMMLRMSGEQIRRVFFHSRLPLLIFPLLTAFLLWRWGRQLFRPATAVLIVLAYALEPTALAHGALFKNDLAATFTYLLFWFCAWKFWQDPRLAPAACLGGATLLAALSKMSMLFLIGVAPCLIALRYFTRRGMGARKTAAALLLVVLIPYLGIIAAYQFDTRRIPAPEMSAYSRDPYLPKVFVAAAQIFRFLPVATPMWRGCLSLLHGNADRTPVYLLGQVRPGGSLFYFPVALAVKVSAALQLLLCGGVVLAVLAFRQRCLRLPDAFWLAPGFLYIGLASLAALQFGVRLVLPALPFGLLLCGVAMEWLSLGRRRVVLMCLLGWLAFQSARIYPHGISYFNSLAGGPDNGLHYLAGSNLDWGQALPDLADYVHSNGIGNIKLSYFGTNNPWGYFREEEIEAVTPPWSDSLVRSNRLEPQPGWYAISATLLSGAFFEPRYRDYYQAFRETEPIAIVGHSIYLYKTGIAGGVNR